MDRSNDKYPVLLRNVSYEIHDFVTSRRVESTGGFVEKQNSWTCDELTGHTHTTLLAARYAFSDRRSDQCVSLVLETKGRQEAGYASLACCFAY